MLKLAQICKKYIIYVNLRTTSQEGKKETKQMTSFFIYFLSSNCLWYSFLYLKNVKIPPWSILVYKIPELWRWKLWDQNFVVFDSGNMYIEENKEPGFTFSIELRTKFFWSHGLINKMNKTNKQTNKQILNKCTPCLPWEKRVSHSIRHY